MISYGAFSLAETTAFPNIFPAVEFEHFHIKDESEPIDCYAYGIVLLKPEKRRKGWRDPNDKHN